MNNSSLNMNFNSERLKASLFLFQNLHQTGSNAPPSPRQLAGYGWARRLLQEIIEARAKSSGFLL